MENIDKCVLDMFEKEHLNNNFENIKINKDINEKVLPYQTMHIFNMINAVTNNKVAIDCSQTGTGKTYTSIAVCKQMKLKPFIVCPKSLVGKWIDVANHFDLELLGISNYELLRNGKKININSRNQEECEYIKVNKGNEKKEEEKEEEEKKEEEKNKKKAYKAEWKLNGVKHGYSTKGVMIIFDEVHLCKNKDSYGNKILLGSVKTPKNVKILMLSATICEKIQDFGVYGIVMGLYSNMRTGKSWIESMIRQENNKIKKTKHNAFHDFLFPKYGARMTIDDIGDDFPTNNISFECFDVDENKLQEVRILEENRRKNEKMGKGCALEGLNKLRECLELIKCDIMLELLEKYMDEGKSVVLFVNYTASFNKIKNSLKNRYIYSELSGGQDAKERGKQIDNFQTNKVKIMVAMIQVGGLGNDLHDKYGNNPRVSLISPSFSSIQLVQTLGRVYRSETKTPVYQRIIFCRNTYEERIAKILEQKKAIISTITDNDLGY